MQELEQLAYACDIEVKTVVTQNLDSDFSSILYWKKGKSWTLGNLVEHG